MKKILPVVFLLIFVVAVASISFAAENNAVTPATAPAVPASEQAATAPAAKEEANRRQITGEITAIDTAAKTFTVKGRKGEVMLSFDDKLKVTEGEATKALTDLKAGIQVTVKYMEMGGKNMARGVKIKSASEKTTSKK
jgi:uncharacterized protein YxeA